jgi:hypothetical protein
VEDGLSTSLKLSRIWRARGHISEQAYSYTLAGDLLTKVYIETKKTPELQSQGGAQVKVKAVQLVQVSFQSWKNPMVFVRATYGM